jgi:hypothetical protein
MTASPQHAELLMPQDLMVWAAIELPREDGHPARIDDLCRSVWPEHSRETARRAVKASVRRLRRAGYKVGSTRGEDPGLYVIRTSQDLARTVRPLLRQALDQLKTIEALTGKQYYVRELAGQMLLFEEAGFGTRG